MEDKERLAATHLRAKKLASLHRQALGSSPASGPSQALLGPQLGQDPLTPGPRTAPRKRPAVAAIAAPQLQTSEGPISLPSPEPSSPTPSAEPQHEPVSVLAPVEEPLRMSATTTKAVQSEQPVVEPLLEIPSLTPTPTHIPTSIPAPDEQESRPEPRSSTEELSDPDTSEFLHTAQPCYICKANYKELHHFYDRVVHN